MKLKSSPIWIFQLLLGFVLITLLGFLCGNACAHEYELNGVMTDEPAGHPPFACNMHVYVRDCRWAIFQTWESPTNRIVTQMSDDGTNIYTLDHVETPSLKNGWEAMPNSYVGNIYPSGFPYRVVRTEIVALFYAYASSCYLDSVTNGLLGPIKFHPGQLMMGDARVSVNLYRNSFPPRLPECICFLNIEGSKVQWTNVVLRAFDFTNLGSIQIPSAVELIRYRPKQATIFTRYEFRVTNILDQCSLKSFTPFLPAHSFVEDNRFATGRADVPPITYGQTTNSQWPTVDEAKLQPSYKVTQLDWQKIRQRHRMIGTPKQVLVIRGILYIMFSVGVISIGLKVFTKKIRK
jgi:hypothetical protein